MAVSIEVQIEEPFIGGMSSDWLRSAAQTILEAEGHHTGELTLVITSDEAVRALNREYLAIDASTDVLAFGGQTPDFVSPPGEEPYLGDVMISFPRAQAQAASAGHPVEAELALLVVHGVLHLLGYDHLQPGDKAVMWDRQRDALSQLGLAHVQPA